MRKRVEHFAQIMPTLAGIKRKQDQVRRGEDPILVADIGRAGFALGQRPQILRLGLDSGRHWTPPASTRHADVPEGNHMIGLKAHPDLLADGVIVMGRNQ